MSSPSQNQQPLDFQDISDFPSPTNSFHLKSWDSAAAPPPVKVEDSNQQHLVMVSPQDFNQTFVLTPLSSHCYYDDKVTVSFVQTFSYRFGMRKDIVPRFNKDKNSNTPGFYVQYFIESLDSWKDDFKKMKKEQMNYSDRQYRECVPRKDLKKCYVCRESFEDYKRHIQLLKHKKRIKHSIAEKFIRKLIRKVSKRRKKNKSAAKKAEKRRKQAQKQKAELQEKNLSNYHQSQVTRKNKLDQVPVEVSPEQNQKENQEESKGKSQKQQKKKPIKKQPKKVTKTEKKRVEIAPQLSQSHLREKNLGKVKKNKESGGGKKAKKVKCRNKKSDQEQGSWS